MNPSVLGGGAALLVVLAWLITRRKPVPVLRSTDASEVAALNRAQITQVIASAAAPQAPEAMAQEEHQVGLVLPVPGDARGRAELLRELAVQLQGTNAERLAAISVAASWADRSVLPLLRRGLRDVDPRVVLAASTGMAAFRGRTAGQGVLGQIERLPLPRNVAALS